MADANGMSQPEMVLELAKAGATLEDIAASPRVRYTPEQAKAELELLLASKHPGLPTETALELERLDMLNRAVWTRAVGGDREYVTEVRAISARRTALMDQVRKDERAATPAARMNKAMSELLDHTVRNAPASGNDVPGDYDPATTTKE